LHVRRLVFLQLNLKFEVPIEPYKIYSNVKFADACRSCVSQNTVLQKVHTKHAAV